jgi:seryl-tRNA synthetase
MEEGEGAFSHEREAKGQNINIGNAETLSNGHRSRGEQETLIETVRNLRIEVQSYKVENQNMMREQNQVNAQMMQSLNQLQRQAKNGSDTTQGEEGRHHEIRDNYKRIGHSKSVSRNHRHHSPPYSARKFYVFEDSMSSL